MKHYVYFITVLVDNNKTTSLAGSATLGDTSGARLNLTENPGVEYANQGKHTKRLKQVGAVWGTTQKDCKRYGENAQGGTPHSIKEEGTLHK